MREKVTTGPWAVVGYEKFPHSYRVYGHGGKASAIADIFHEPDANLIAAAPDLLEALKVMAARAVPSTPHWKDDLEIAAAQAAIAKAEGRD